MGNVIIVAGSVLAAVTVVAAVLSLLAYRETKRVKKELDEKIAWFSNQADRKIKELNKKTENLPSGMFR
jgi:hypothetical protein